MKRAARASLAERCQLHSLLSHSCEGSPHTPRPETVEEKLGTLLWSPRPALVRVQSALLDLLLPATLASPAAQKVTFLPISSS